MPAHNNLNLTGNLAGDRRINHNRMTGEEVGISFCLAVSKRVPDPDAQGEWKDDADFFWINVSAANRSYDYLKRNLVKGKANLLSVHGSLRQYTREVESRRPGSETSEVKLQSSIDIVGIDVQILRFSKRSDAPVPSEEGTPPEGSPSGSNDDLGDGFVPSDSGFHHEQDDIPY